MGRGASAVQEMHLIHLLDSFSSLNDLTLELPLEKASSGRLSHFLGVAQLRGFGFHPSRSGSVGLYTRKKFNSGRAPSLCEARGL